MEIIKYFLVARWQYDSSINVVLCRAWIYFYFIALFGFF